MSRGSPSIKLAIAMADASRRALFVRDGLAAVAEWEAEHGAFTEAELADARKRVFGGRRRARG